jgi:hypothetical protein
MMLSKVHLVKTKADQRPYVVQVESADELRSFVLAFKVKSDAHMFAKMLECHKDMHGAWPEGQISPEKQLSIEANKYVMRRQSLKELVVHSLTWDELQYFAFKNMIHIMVMENMGDKITTSLIMYQYTTSFAKICLEDPNV